MVFASLKRLPAVPYDVNRCRLGRKSKKKGTKLSFRTEISKPKKLSFTFRLSEAGNLRKNIEFARL